MFDRDRDYLAGYLAAVDALRFLEEVYGKDAQVSISSIISALEHTKLVTFSGIGGEAKDD